MIELKNLTKTFEDFIAVDSLNLQIASGEFFGLLGPNGAGKTTTIGMLSTLLLPTKGEILINGERLTRKRQDIKRKVSVITQEYQSDRAAHKPYLFSLRACNAIFACRFLCT